MIDRDLSHEQFILMNVRCGGKTLLPILKLKATILTGYSAAGYSQECKACENPHGSRYFADILEIR